MKRVFFLVVLLILASSAFASDEMARQFLDKANKFYLVKDYDKAIIHINFLFKLYSDEQMPEEAKTLANFIYFDYIKSILTAKNYTKLDDIEMNLSAHPLVYDEKVKMFLKQARKQQEDENLQKQKEQERIQKLEEEAKILAQIEQERKEKKEEELKRNQAEFELRKQDKEDFIRMQEKILLENKEQEERSKREMNQIINRILEIQKAPQQKDLLSDYLPVIIISIISFIFLTTFIFVLIIFMRHMRKEQMTMDYTFKAMIQLPEYQLLESKNMKQFSTLSPQLMNGFGEKTQAADTPAANLPSAQNEFERMLDMCKNYGDQIDKLTHRKNTSRNVGEIVYKISKFLNHDEHESMLYYMVGLVHDIGFMNIDSTLFQLKTLKDDQYKLMKTHVTEGLKMIGFIPEEFKQIFIEGISKHHENMDGSGYPEGLAGEKIPYIARVIRVVESYVALISMRAYRDIKTRETAVDMIRQDSDKYDISIVDALDNVI